MSDLTDITSRDLASEVMGEEKILAHQEVHNYYARIARVVRSMIADDLGVEMAPRGKEFVTTDRGSYRVAMGDNSDNTTEVRAHDSMGAGSVQVLGPVKRHNTMTLGELYAKHGKTLDSTSFIQRIKDAL